MSELYYIGMDLCSDFTQLSYYNDIKREPESVSQLNNKDTYLMPNILFYSTESERWYVGGEASEARFSEEGVVVDSIFEVNPRLVGMRINGIKVRDYGDLEKYLEENTVDIGIICTTKNSAQEVADKLCAGGVRGIWNFTALDVVVPDDVALENVHLSDNLHSLSYYMENGK